MNGAPAPAIERFLAWQAHRLTPTMTNGEALLAVPVLAAWIVSLILLGGFLDRWLRHRRLRREHAGAGGGSDENGLVLVSRANFRREAYRAARLTMWVLVALTLVTDWRYRGVVFVLGVLGYAATELANALLELGYQRRMERYLGREGSVRR